MPRKKRPEPLPSADELRVLLARAVHDRSLSVAAIKLLLEEIRRDDDEKPAGILDRQDEVAARREKRG